MTNDVITLVSKWENRLHPPNPSDKKNYSVWPTSFPKEVIGTMRTLCVVWQIWQTRYNKHGT